MDEHLRRLKRASAHDSSLLPNYIAALERAVSGGNAPLNKKFASDVAIVDLTNEEMQQLARGSDRLRHLQRIGWRIEDINGSYVGMFIDVEWASSFDAEEAARLKAPLPKFLFKLLEDASNQGYSGIIILGNMVTQACFMPADWAGLRRNPLRAKHAGIQSANPVTPEVDELFKHVMGRSIKPEENEGIHTALFASISVGYAFSAAEADGSEPVLVTLSKVGLNPQLDAEGIAIKRLLTNEKQMIKKIFEFVDEERPESPEEWLERAEEYYEYEDVNPFAILSSQFWRNPAKMIEILRMWVQQPSDDLIMEMVGSQRYLEDIPADNIVAVEKLKEVDFKTQVEPLFARKDALETSPDYQYHGTTLAKAREALKGEIPL